MSWAAGRLPRAVLTTAILICGASGADAKEQSVAGFTPSAAQCAALPELDTRLQAITSCKKGAAGEKTTVVRSCMDWWLGWPASCMVPASCQSQVGAYYSHLTGAMGLKDRSGILESAAVAEAVNAQLRISCAAAAKPPIPVRPPTPAKPPTADTPPTPTRPPTAGTPPAWPPMAGTSPSPAKRPAAEKPPPITTGLGEDIDKLVAQSPTLLANFKTIMAMPKVTVVWGPAGGGSRWSYKPPTMVIDSNHKGKTGEVLGTLAHESGHALYSPAHTWDPTLSRADFVKRNLDESLRNEGEATLMNVQIMLEYEKAKIPARVSAGTSAHAAKYVEIYKKYPTDRNKARQEIANWFRDHEYPSGQKLKLGEKRRTYGEEYGKRWGEKYDELHAKP